VVEKLKLVSVLHVLHSEAILSGVSFQLDRCFPEILGVSYRDKFADLAGTNEFTQLAFGVFWWLINIQPRYLIFSAR